MATELKAPYAVKDASNHTAIVFRRDDRQVYAVFMQGSDLHEASFLIGMFDSTMEVVDTDIKKAAKIYLDHGLRSGMTATVKKELLNIINPKGVSTMTAKKEAKPAAKKEVKPDAKPAAKKAGPGKIPATKPAAAPAAKPAAKGKLTMDSKPTTNAADFLSDKAKAKIAKEMAEEAKAKAAAGKITPTPAPVPPAKAPKHAPEGAPVKPEKAPKSAKPEKAAKAPKAAGAGGKLRLDLNAKITAIIDNPKRPGSGAHARYNLYKNNMTVQQFLDAGGIPADIHWDSKQNFIKLVPSK